MFNLPERIRERLPRKKTREEINEHFDSIEKVELEKGDFLAMCIAAFVTFIPVLIIAMVIFYGVIWLLFMR